MSKKENIATFNTDLDYNTWIEAADVFKGDIDIITEVFNRLADDTETFKQGLTALINEMEPDKRKEFINSLK